MKYYIVILSFIASLNLVSAKETSEKVFFNSLNDSYFGILLDKKMPRSEKIVKLRTAIEKNIAIVQVGRSVLGPKWRTLSKTQKRQYLKSFKSWVGNTLAKQLSGFEFNENLVVLSSYKVSKRVYAVQTSIKTAEVKNPVTLDWYISKIKGQPKLIDVAVVGISMVSTQRKQFSSILKTKNIEELISMLDKQAKS